MQSTAHILQYPEPRLPNPAHMQQLQVVGGTDQEIRDPRFTQDDATLFMRLKDWICDGRDRTDEWRRIAEAEIDATAGWQWSDDDIKILEEDSRPVVTFNRLARNIDLVTGLDINNRQEVTFMPRTQGSVEKSEILSSAVAWIDDETDSGYTKADAFRDLCICGMGWTDTSWNARDFINGMPTEDRCDPLEMYWDANATQRNIKDSRWRARIRTVPLAEAQRLFPETHPSMLDAVWTNVKEDPSHPTWPERQSYSYENTPEYHQAAPLNQRVTLVEIQWFEYEDFAVVQDLMTGEQQEMPMQRAQMLTDAMQGRYAALPVQRKAFYKAFLGGQILRKTKLENLRDFTFQVMTGKRDRRKIGRASCRERV